MFSRDGGVMLGHCWDRPGAGFGETELNRLFYRLGWTKGWYKGVLRNKAFGEITNGDQTPDWKTIRTKLLDLAKKYDTTAKESIATNNDDRNCSV